jgi:hypothetical protein
VSIDMFYFSISIVLPILYNRTIITVFV